MNHYLEGSLRKHVDEGTRQPMLHLLEHLGRALTLHTAGNILLEETQGRPKGSRWVLTAHSNSFLLIR